MNVWRSYGIDPENPDAKIELTTEDRESAKHNNRLMFFLSRDAELSAFLSNFDLNELFEVDHISYHTKHVDDIFQRVFKKA